MPVPRKPAVLLVAIAGSTALLTACAIQARSFLPEIDPTVEDCSTPGDEDGNGLADCRDPVCAALPACQPPCGNGVLDPGELCDDGNTVGGDGCDASCQIEPFQTIASHPISNGMHCVGGGAHTIAVDDRSVIYAVISCGSSMDVVTSTDLGRSFSPPHDVSSDLPGAPAFRGALVAAAPGGGAYVGIVSGDGMLYVRATQDGGKTWSAGTSAGPVASGASVGLALQAFQDDVYGGLPSSGGVLVARNHMRGVGSFDTTTLTTTNVFFDVMCDAVTGMIVEAGDNPSFFLRVSHDAGATFGDEGRGSGFEYFSSWALGNGTLYVSGINLPNLGGNATQLYVMPLQAQPSVPSVSGLPAVSDPSGGGRGRRSLAADAAGNAFIVSQLNAGGIQLDRLAFGTSALDPARMISPTGLGPAVAPLPGNQGAAVMYADAADTWVAIEVY